MIIFVQINQLALDLFKSGQNELSGRQPEVEKDKSGREICANKYKLLVIGNAVCLQLLVWAAQDETGFYIR